MLHGKLLRRRLYILDTACLLATPASPTSNSPAPSPSPRLSDDTQQQLTKFDLKAIASLLPYRSSILEALRNRRLERHLSEQHLKRLPTRTGRGHGGQDGRVSHLASDTPFHCYLAVSNTFLPVLFSAGHLLITASRYVTFSTYPN